MKTRYLRGAALISLTSAICSGCGQSDDAMADSLSENATPADSSSAPMTVGAPAADSMDAMPSGAAPNSPAPPASMTGTEQAPTIDPVAPPTTDTPDSEATVPLPVNTPMPTEPVDPPDPVEGFGGAESSEGPGGMANSGGKPDPGDLPGGSGGSAGGTSGPAGASGDPVPSAGCGMEAPAECVPCQANGQDYFIDMPDNYDPSHPYPVVFQYHPLGGSGQQARTMYRVQPTFPDAIYISPDGSDNGFPNPDGVDEEVTRTIMESIEASLCVDTARYFATGFSYGGSMSYTAACNMSDKFRAVAAMAGAPISGAKCTSQDPQRPVAVLGIHGEEDTALPITMAEPIIETWLDKNGCTRDTQPSDLLDSICEKSASALEAGAYQGCMEGYPVIWCPMPGRPHEIPMWSGAAISRFFQQF